MLKGQKGIRILAPMIGSRRKKRTEAERSKDPAAINTPVLVGFRAVYVFDVSQTEGAELPQFAERGTGEVGEYRERLIDFTIGQGIELEFREFIAPVLGMSYGGKIAILPGQTPAEEFSTLVHELAHEMLHKPSAAPQPPRRYARQRPRQLPSLSARPSAWTGDTRQPTTSTSTTATQHF